MKKSFIAIYEDGGAENLAHVVNTIEEAAAWIGCHVQALYKALQLSGVMNAKGYYIERIREDE